METKFKLGDVVRYVGNYHLGSIGIIRNVDLTINSATFYTVNWVDHKEHHSGYVNSQLEKLDTDMARILYSDEIIINANK